MEDYELHEPANSKTFFGEDSNEQVELDINIAILKIN